MGWGLQESGEALQREQGWYQEKLSEQRKAWEAKLAETKVGGGLGGGAWPRG